MKNTLIPDFKALSVAGAVAAAMLLSGNATAATTIDSVSSNFTLGKPVTHPLGVQPSSWYNSAFGDMGWTHFSKWGKVTLQAGRTYQITLVSGDKKMHPGVSVWYRYTGAAYAPVNYVTNHSYLQFGSLEAKNQIDETTQKNVKTIKLEAVINGFDKDRDPATTDAADANPKKNVAFPSMASFNGVSDGVPGTLVMKFKAMKTGTYQFVYGATSPDDNAATAKVAATATTPEVPAGFNHNSKRIPVTVTIKQVAK
ncbi:MAG: Copper-repressible polypeptide [Pseudomonadota bacterium]|jgi:hypothetical protein